MTSLACSAPELLTRMSGRIPRGSGSARPESCCPTHAPLKVAETFRNLLASTRRASTWHWPGAGERPADRARAARGMVAMPPRVPRRWRAAGLLGDGFPAATLTRSWWPAACRGAAGAFRARVELLLAFASHDDEAIVDFEAAWTPDHPEIRRDIVSRCAEQIHDFARSRSSASQRDGLPEW